MPPAQFEEKSFEVALNHQLLEGSPHIFAPGQVLEAALGFDAAIRTDHAGFWSMWGRTTPLAGAQIQSAWWPGARGSIPPLPHYRINVFLQYKRPFYLQQKNAGQWSAWGGRYYRYYVYSHQQAALEACAAGLQSNGLVAYASPAFWTLQKLWQHTENGVLVQETNFVEATSLRGHSLYTYVNAGNHGQAFSEPVSIPAIDIVGSVSTRANGSQRVGGLNIFQTADLAITEAIRAAPAFFGRPLQVVITRMNTAASRALEVIGPLPDDARESIVMPYLRVQYACWLLGWGWLVGGISAR